MVVEAISGWRYASCTVAAGQSRTLRRMDARRLSSATRDTAQAAKVTCTRKVEERKAELASRKQQLADVLQDNDQLRAQIANQSLSRADVNRRAGPAVG